MQGSAHPYEYFPLRRDKVACSQFGIESRFQRAGHNPERLAETRVPAHRGYRVHPCSAALGSFFAKRPFDGGEKILMRVGEIEMLGELRGHGRRDGHDRLSAGQVFANLERIGMLHLAVETVRIDRDIENPSPERKLLVRLGTGENDVQ